MEELIVTSTLDQAEQPVLFDKGQDGAPLLVGLHTWSADRFNQQKMLDLTKPRGWHLLLPEFRGPNLTTNPQCRQAGGSELAKQDIVDAVKHVQKYFSVGKDIFLLGGSGGGHMSLLMAAKAPLLWTAVSSWCPITDLAQWRLQNSNYKPHIEACCGGVPQNSPQVAQEYADRSPINHLAGLSKAHVFIHHGKDDPSVPSSHTVDLYHQLFHQYPDARVYCEIFPGGHECQQARALQWFDQLHNKEKTKAEELSK